MTLRVCTYNINVGVGRLVYHYGKCGCLYQLIGILQQTVA